jgi:hypothetical protein
VGPIVFYKTDGSPKSFHFADLQDQDLLLINYENWSGIKDIVPHCINFVRNIQRVDTTRQVTLLLYLINPPKLSFRYSIKKGKKDSISDFVDIEKVNCGLPFTTLTLPILPDDEEYKIVLDVYDSILSKKNIIVKNLPD